MSSLWGFRSHSVRDQLLFLLKIFLKQFFHSKAIKWNQKPYLKDRITWLKWVTALGTTFLVITIILRARLEDTIEPSGDSQSSLKTITWCEYRRMSDSAFLALKMEDGGHKPRIMGSHRSWKGQGNGSYPRASRKQKNKTKQNSANTFVLPQGYPCWTFDLQNHKIINLYCFNPSSL